MNTFRSNLVLFIVTISCCSAGQIKCNQADGCNDSCVGDTCACDADEDCQFFCETNYEYICNNKTVIPPTSSTGDFYDFDIDCTVTESCRYLNAYGATSIFCQHEDACYGAELSCADHFGASEICDIECNQADSCAGALISCPHNAGCTLTCQNGATCNIETINYSPFHAFRYTISNTEPADLEPVQAYDSAGCSGSQYVCSGMCVDDPADCAMCLSSSEPTSPSSVQNQGITFDIEVDSSTDGVYVTDFTVSLQQLASDMTFRVWFTTDGDSESNHRSATAWNNGEWEEVASVQIGTVGADRTLVQMGFDMNRFIPAGSTQGVYIEHDGSGDEIHYYNIGGSTSSSIAAGGDSVIDIIGGATVNDGFEDPEEDRAFRGSVCYMQAPPPFPGTTQPPASEPPATPLPTPISTSAPTQAPTAQPTAEPTATPTAEPTATPTAEPTASPTAEPTASPTSEPTASPTAEPTASPTASPTSAPTASPTSEPTASPTSAPTGEPTNTPSSAPTSLPTSMPTLVPTMEVTAVPTQAPTETTTTTTNTPTTDAPPPATNAPTAAPPTAGPTSVPTAGPTSVPTAGPTLVPTEPPPVNIVDESRFNSLGTMVYVDFLVETNGATLFQSSTSENCQALFETQSLIVLGTDARCRFDSARRLTVEIFSESRLEPQEIGDGVLTLADSAVTGLIRFDTNSGAARETFNVSLPEDPALPVARVSAPSQVGRCASEAVRVSGLLSSGFVGRTRHYEWTFSCGIDSTSGEEPEITINMEAVPVDTVCEIQLVVRNFLDIESVPATTAVLRTTLDVPTLEVFPDEASPWTRNEIHVVVADVDFPSCLNRSDLDDSSLGYSWEVSDTSNSPATLVELDSMDVRVLTIRSFQLEVGHTYQFNATVSDSSNSFSDIFGSYEAFIEHAPIEAVISGAAAVIEHPIEIALVLDASESSDGDFAVDESLPSGHFDYEWSCDQALRDGTTIETFVASSFPESAWSACDFALTAQQLSGVQLNIGVNSFTEENVYRLALDVSTDDGRVSTDGVFVFGTRSPIPQVSISAPEALLSFAVLRLEGHVEGDISDFTYEWSEQNYDLTSRADFASFLRTPVGSINLALNPGLLEDGVQYAFRLTATERSTALQGSSIAFVHVSSGPVVQDFSVALLDRDTGEVTENSAGGFEQTDVYRLSVSAYFPASSEDLEYYFGYYAADESTMLLQDTSTTERLLTDSQIFPFADVRLPAGALTLVAHVVSESGLESTDELPLEVFPLAPTNPNSCAVLNETDAEMQSALDEGLSDEWFQSAQILADLLLREDFVSRCVGDVDSQRNDLFADIPVIWGLQSFHSPHRVQQLAQLVETLSMDTENFSLEQIGDSVEWVDTIFDAIDDAIDEGVDADSVRFAAAVANILSNALTASGLEFADGGEPDAANLALYCDVVQEVQRQLNRLLQSAVAEQLADEDAAVLDSGSIVARAIRAASGQGSTEIDVEGSEISITVSGGTGAASSVSFSSFDDTVRQCFESTDESQELVGAIIDISILECENQERGDVECEFTVDNVSFGLSHQEVTLAAGTCQDGELREEVLQCSFWDAENSVWSTDGCETITLNEESVQCVCQHLTTFAVVKNFRSQLDDQCATALSLDQAAALFFLVAYGIVAGSTLFQMSRLWRYSVVASVTRGVLTHSLIFISCLCQALTIACLRWLEILWLIEVCSALQAAIHFGIFATVAQQWATLYHGVFPKENKIRDSLLKYAFTIGAVFVGLILVAALAMMAASPVGSSMFNTASTIGSIGIASLSVVCAIVFLIYGSLLYRMVRSTYNVVKSSNRAAKTRDAANRIFKFMVILSTTFIIEGLLTMVSVVNEDLFTRNFTLLQSLYLALNLVSIVAIVTLFAKLVDVAARRYHDSKPSSRNGAKGSAGPLPLSESSMSTQLASVNDYPASISRPSSTQPLTTHMNRPSLTGNESSSPLLAVGARWRRKRMKTTGDGGFSRTSTGFASGHTLTNSGFVNPQSTEAYSVADEPAHPIHMQQDPMTMTQSVVGTTEMMSPKRTDTDNLPNPAGPDTMTRRPLLSPTLPRGSGGKLPHPPPTPAPLENRPNVVAAPQLTPASTIAAVDDMPSAFDCMSIAATAGELSPVPTINAPPVPHAHRNMLSPPVLSPASTGYASSVYIRPREPSVIVSRESTGINFEFGGNNDDPPSRGSTGFAAVPSDTMQQRTFNANAYQQVPDTMTRRYPGRLDRPLTYVSTGFSSDSHTNHRPEMGNVNYNR